MSKLGGWVEFVVLNKPSFKVIGFDGDKWYNIHNGDTAAPPSVNDHRWHSNIKSYPVAEFIALKSKINHWKGRKQHRDFNQEKFDSYNKSFYELLENFEEEIYTTLSSNEYKHVVSFLPRNVQDIFIF